jgi:formylglycine-generating enzyme required for sulfatase activity
MEKRITDSLVVDLAYIPAGEFLMGSPESEARRCTDEKQHLVRITKPYFIGVTPVTQEQWEAVIGENPCQRKCAMYPVEMVSWLDCQKFLEKVNSQYSIDGMICRLPTEAEWEYVCRAGNKSTYYFGDDESQLHDHGWYQSNSCGGTHAVGEQTPNALGLFDMHGNVWEWCEDWYVNNYGGFTSANPQGASSGSLRVHRGGSWKQAAANCRSASRNGDRPDFRSNDLGFRIVLAPLS